MKIIRKIIYFPFTIINYLLLKFNRVVYNSFPDIRGIITIMNEGKMHIGSNVKINSSKYFNVIGGSTRSSFVVRRDAELKISNNVKISNSALYCTNKITIKDNVMIGGNTKIWDTDFHSLNADQRKVSPNENSNSKPISIENNAFIGGSSIILKGVTIGENSILAAGSVLSKSIPQNQIWGGNPAKYIKDIPN